LPLAIELAAARSTLLPPRLMLTHLKGRLMALGTGPRDAPRRQQTIQATLEWGYQLLRAKERMVLASLSVFAGSMDLDTVLALHADDTQDGWTADDVLVVIGQLLEQSWLQRQETPSGEVRFAMLHVIREFLRTVHGSDPSWNTWAERYRREIQGLMVQAGAAYRTVDEQRWFTRLEQDLPNVREVLQWHVLHPDVTTGGASIVALVGFWWMRSMRMEGLTWFQKLLDVLPSDRQGSLFHARVLYGIGKLEPKSGTSIPALEASLAIHRTLGPSYAMLETLNWLAYMHGTRGAAQIAIPLYEEALALVPGYGNDLIHIAVVHNLGLIWTDVNEDLATGIHYFREAYAMARVLGNPEYLAMIERSLGSALCAFGAGTEGIPYLEQALRRAREVALTHYVPTLLNSLADAYEDHGRDTDCYVLLREGVEIQQHIADMEYLPWTLYLLASLYARTDQPLIAAAMLGVAESMRQDLARLLIRRYHTRVTALTAQLKRTLGDSGWEWASRAWEGWDSITIRSTVLALDPPCLETSGEGPAMR
jgi:tetratricopeptide (TPR) repeat protein